MKFTILFLQIVLLTAIVSSARPRRNRSKAEKSSIEDQVAEPSHKETVRHKRGHYHSEVHSVPLHVHVIKKPKHRVKKIHIIPHEEHKEPEVSHSYEEIHENIEIPEKKIIEDKSFDIPVESHGEHELVGDETKHIFAEHTEKIKVKHHHHHHHHVKTVVKKEPYPVEKVVHIPVEKIVHVPKPYPVERVVEKVVEVPVEKIVEKIVHVPKPYPVEKIVEKPIHIEKKVPFEVKVPVPVEKIVHVPKPYPVEKIVEKIVHVPKPYPVIRHVPFPVEVKVPIHIPKPVPYPVEKKVPYPVEVEKKVPIPVKVEVEKKVPYPVKVYVPQPVHVAPQAPAYHYEKPQESYSDHKGPIAFEHGGDYHSQGTRVHEVQIPKPVYEDQRTDNTKNHGKYASGQNGNLRSLSYQQLLHVQQQYQQQQQQYQQQQQSDYQQQPPHRPHYHQHHQSQLQYQQEQQEQQQNFLNQAQRYVQHSAYSQQTQQQASPATRQLRGAESIQQQVAILPNAPVPNRDANFQISVPDNFNQQESLLPQASQYINPAVVTQLQPVQWAQIQTFQPPPGYQ